MRYPQTFVDDLKRQADIVRVIQDYVQLKKKGANWMACCPFHKEKTPSFSVSPTKELFYCFGCHKGGTVFNFVMEIEGVGFAEAIKIVADRVGMPLPKLVDDERFAIKRQEADEVIQLNGWALEWWEKQLETSGEGSIARDYLERREITDDTRKTFRLGYSPDSWEALLSYLRHKGATQAQIERSGLVVKKDEGGSYDRFRGRLMFPVFDTQGRPIAFGGRTLKDEDAKYINSPETAAYVKGRNLFGLNLTRDEIRRGGFAILVEGFLDLIVPYQFGVRNVVASLGTALTADQVKLLSRFARKVVVNYDGDRAGVQAAKKSIEILLAEDIEVKVLVLPENADPDEFIRKFGAAEYQQRRAKAQPHIQFVIENALRDRSLHRPAEKAEAVEDVLPYIRAINSRIQKREYFDMAMDGLQINDVSLRRELWHSLRTPSNVTGSAREKILRRTGVKPTVAEQRLLELLLANEKLRRDILPSLQKSDYEELATASIFNALIEIEEQGVDPDFEVLTQKVEGDTTAQELLPMLLMGVLGPQEEKEADLRIAVERCLDALRLVNIDRRIRELSTEISAAERDGNEARVLELISEKFDLDLLRKSFEPQRQIAQLENR
ncbi:MAG TPA: DNA primase [Pyrinomonadaceae bacterium]|jgi:DNA primase|nr:DNA primase [Pyrinomonadaceae bacterium]